MASIFCQHLGSQATAKDKITIQGHHPTFEVGRGINKVGDENRDF